MKYLPLVLILLCCGAVGSLQAEQSATELSDKMRAILKAEMAALATHGRAVETALERGDSAAVAEHARAMEQPFIFDGDVTTVDLRELELVLGEDFVARDKAFHAAGRALEAAAKAGDLMGQQVIFQDMLKACASCHQAYAPEAPVLD